MGVGPVKLKIGAQQAPRLLVEFIRVFFGVDVLTQTKGGDYKRDVHHIGRGEVVDSGLQ